MPSKHSVPAAVQLTGSGSTVERLLHHLFDGALHEPLAEELAEWLAASARYRAFTEAHRDKIRKKLRGALDAEARLDVRAELRAAHLLLADQRIKLAFEAYGSRTVGPDFSVSFRSRPSFNLELTRPRPQRSAPALGGPLLAKLRQLPPSVPNAVVLAIQGDDADAFDVAGTIRALRARADAKDEDYVSGRGLDGTRGFHQRYLRLGGVLVWCEGAAGARTALWTNRSARMALPSAAVQASVICLRGG